MIWIILSETLVGVGVCFIVAAIGGTILFRVLREYRPWWRIWTTGRDIDRRYER